MTEERTYYTIQPQSRQDNHSNNDTAVRVAVFSDIDEAIAFRRQFPHWEVHCLLVFPCYTKSGKDTTKALVGNERTIVTCTNSAKQDPIATMIKQAHMIELAHPILDVPATADILGFWRENGRLLGLELHFPDGHHAFLTFQEIQELQTS